MRGQRRATGGLALLLVAIAVSSISCDETMAPPDEGFTITERAVTGGGCDPGRVIACYSEEPQEDEDGTLYCQEGARTCGDDGTWGECEIDPSSERFALIGDPELCGGCDPACFHDRDVPVDEDLDDENHENVFWDDEANGLVLGQGGGGRYIYLASDPGSTVSKVSIETGAEVGRYYVGHPYRTGWSGNRPSRSAIDSRSNAYVASRSFNYYGYLTKIGGSDDQCVDRNRNGRIDTSRSNRPMAWGTDECVVWNRQVCGYRGVPRAVAIDAAGMVWVGCYNTRQFQVVDPETGRVTKTVSVRREPYGAAIDGNNTLWYTTRGCEPRREAYRYCWTEAYRYCYWRTRRVCGWESYRYCYWQRYYTCWNQWEVCWWLWGWIPIYCWRTHCGWRNRYVCQTRWRYVCRDIREYVCETRYRTRCETRYRTVYDCARHIQSVNVLTGAVGALERNDVCYDHYGIAIDHNNRVWVACMGHPTYRLARYDPRSDRWTGVSGIDRYTRGVTIDADGDVWVASSQLVNYGASYGWEIDPDRAASPRRWHMTGCNGAIGIGADYENQIWFNCYGSNHAARLDPATRRTRFTRVGQNPYTYSDFTGFLRSAITAPEGFYRRLHDRELACEADQDVLWSQLYFEGETPPGTSMSFYGKTAERSTDLGIAREFLIAEMPGDSSPTSVEDAMAAAGVENGLRYLDIRVELRTTRSGETPIFRSMDLVYYCQCSCDTDNACTPGCTCDSDC